jgi:hypothetical protein
MSTNDGTGQDLGDPGVYAMTPEQATTKLDEMTAAYRGGAPENPQTAAEATARLQALTNDPKFVDRLLRGNPQARAELDRLTTLVANLDETPSGDIETVTGPYALRRAHYEGMIDGLRDGGLPDTAEQYIRELDAGLREDRPTQGDGHACQQMIDRLLKDAGFREKYLAGDIAAVNNINALARIVSYAADDGKTLSEDVAKQLANIRPR